MEILGSFSLPSVPAGINAPNSYSGKIVKFTTLAKKSDFCWPIQTFFGPLFKKKSEFGPCPANSDQLETLLDVPKTFLCPKTFGPKKFWVKKCWLIKRLFLVNNKIMVQKNLGQLPFWVLKILGPEKKFGSEQKLGLKNLTQCKCRGEYNSFSPINIGGQNREGYRENQTNFQLHGQNIIRFWNIILAPPLKLWN